VADATPMLARLHPYTHTRLHTCTLTRLHAKKGDDGMLRFVRLRFEAEVTNDGTLPRFFGPTLRGALGLNFRKMVCVTHLDDCSQCILRFQCPYTRFFEPFAPADHPFAKRLVQMPRPFSLQVPPPSNSPVTFKVGDAFSFGMTIWHQAENLLPYLIVAVQRTLANGIGKGLKASLVRVVAGSGEDEMEVFSAREGIIVTSLPSVSAGEILASTKEKVSRLIVRFVTPTRIDLSGKLQNPVTFSALVKGANERGRALFWAYERTEPPWDGKVLVETARKVEMTDGEQVWLDLQRFSRRQQESLKVGGVIGWTEFEGEDLSPFLPLLKLMEWVHVGKLGTMGLGQIVVEAS
jgi:hypothetical protein